MAYVILILIAVIFFILSNKEDGSHSVAYTPKIEPYNFDNITRIANSSYSCSTSSGAKKRLDELNSLFDSAKIAGESDKVLSYISFEISDVQELVDSLERSEWEEKASKILSDFLDAFIYVTTEEYHSFRDIENVLNTSKKCVRLWYKYWKLLEDIHVRVNPKEYMKEYLGDSFEPCMLESAKLKKRLDDATEKIKPEHRRKMKLYNDIIKTVADSGSIMQCELKKQHFDNASQKEVEFCYNDLIASNRLVRVKIGSRYFVSLSDKEKEMKGLQGFNMQDTALENR